METKTKIKEELENLCRKADQTRSIHNMMKDRVVFINQFFLLYVAIGSAISAMLIFSSIPSNCHMWVGIFMASVFIASIIPSTLNFNLKILEKTLAIQTWGEWIRDTKYFCNVEISQIDSNSVELKQKEFVTSYKKIMDNTPLIPDKKFNKYKRLHLQKIEISKALDREPFKKINQIKKDILSK